MFSLHTKWIITEFLEGSLLNWCEKFYEWCITNSYKYNQEYGKLKKWIPSQMYFKDFVLRYRKAFQVFFKDFGDRFGITCLRYWFLCSCFSKILLIDFRIATNLKTGSSKKCSRKILFIDFKTTTKIIYLKLHQQRILKSFGSNIYLLSSGNSYIHTNIHTYIHTYIHPCIHSSIHPSIHTYIHTRLPRFENQNAKIY